MKYNGKELIEMSPQKWVQKWDGKPREMLAWNCVNDTPVKTRIVDWYSDEHGHIIWRDDWRDGVCKYWNNVADIPNEESDKQKKEIVTKYSLNDCINSLKCHFKSKNEDSPDDEIAFPSLKESYESIIKYLDELKSLKEDRVEPTPVEDVLLTRIKVLKEENEELKAKIAPLRSERVEMADSVSSAVWKELMDRAKTIEGSVNTTMAGFSFNDISDIVLNKIMEHKPIDKPEKKLRRMTYKEVEDWLIQCNGLLRIGNKTYNNIYFDCEDRNKEVRDGIEICGHKEHTWHEPLINEYLDDKSEDKSENTQRRSNYREFAEYLSHGDFGFNGISDIGLTKILKYKPENNPENKTRRMTHRELAHWCANGNGEWAAPSIDVTVYQRFDYDVEREAKEVSEHIKIRGWDETEWHEPLVEE